MLSVWFSVPFDLSRAEEALAAARQLDDKALAVHILLTCAVLSLNDAASAGPYFAQATELARAAGDRRALCYLRAYQCFVGTVSGDPVASHAAGEEGRAIADELGESFMSRYSQTFLSGALTFQGKLPEALQIARSLVDEARAAQDLAMETFGLISLAQVLAIIGETEAARVATQAAIENCAAIGGFHEDTAYVALANAELASGNPAAAKRACEAAWLHTNALKQVFVRSLMPMAEATMACGDLPAARRWADDSVVIVPGGHRVTALKARAQVAIAQGEPQQAERDLHDALEIAERTGGFLRLPDVFECLAALAAAANAEHAARLLGAADGMRQRQGEVRFQVFQADHDATLAKVRDALEPNYFEAAWAEGSALSTAEAIGYARRGRGARGRPASGWESLTPTELDVVRLVSEGLPNKDIAVRLFISPRTVQSHLTHVYTKLAVSSRVQLAQEAARHA
jgi:DNA-binding CsgD family transcriptional regulator